MTTEASTLESASALREDSRTRVNVTLGMVLFIGSWTMAFGTLFLSLFVLRQKFDVWPPVGIALPSFPIATLGTVVLLASSVVLHRAVKVGRAGGERFSGLFQLGILLAVAFSAIQYWLWADLMGNGRLPESGLYESLFYGLTWIHGVHVVAGLLALLWAQAGISSGRYGSHCISTVGNAAIFWHFVDVVWVVLFLTFFVF